MESPFFCDMSALTTEARARHRALATQIRPAIVRFSELDDGYAAEFAMTDETLMRLAEFVSLERLCCPFFTLAVEVGRERGPLSLRITGRDGVKPFIRAEFGIKG